MLSKNVKVKNTDVFLIPIINMDCTWENLIKDYPHMEIEMDGSDEGSFLEVFYKINPLNGIYIFVDEDAESDMADIFGFDLNVCTKGETNLEKTERNKNEIMLYDLFDNLYINENSENYNDDFEYLEEFDEAKEKLKGKILKEQIKQDKKNRRQKVLSEKLNNNNQ